MFYINEYTYIYKYMYLNKYIYIYIYFSLSLSIAIPKVQQGWRRVRGPAKRSHRSKTVWEDHVHMEWMEAEIRNVQILYSKRIDD